MSLAPVPAPRSESELVARARALAGSTLAQIARGLARPVPASQRRAKGWIGELIEAALGATAGSLPEPDFQLIDVELKTLPVGHDGRPRESTYVCPVPLGEAAAGPWQTSWVRRKLARVLWVPVESEREVPLAERRVGWPLLWSPSDEEERMLRADWEELMERVCLGEADAVSARDGEVLQIRPKAANARARRRGVDADGAPAQVLPRGFYLRARFTAALLRRHYALPEASP